MQRYVFAALLLALPLCVRAEVFVPPVSGVLYLKCAGGSGGGTSEFGTGTSIGTFVSYLNSLPQSCPTSEVAVGFVAAGQSVTFGLHTLWGGGDYWAFSTGTDQPSIVSFTDVNNDLGLGGSVIEPTGPNTWLMHLNDASRYTLSSKEANNVLIQLRLAPGAKVPAPPTGGVFVAPYAGTLYLTCIGGSAVGTSQFGLGSTPSSFVSYFSLVPQGCPTSEVSAGTVIAGETVPFAIATSWAGQTFWAFSTSSDQNSVVAFTDVNNKLGLGGNVIEPTGASTWVLHLNDASHATIGGATGDNLLVQLRLQPAAALPSPTITGVGNAASYQPGLSPGMMATLFGTNLSPVAGVVSTGGVTSYQGVSVSVGGRPAPLLTLVNVNGAEQINFQVPAELTAPNTVLVQIANNGSAGSMSIPLKLIQPGIFQYVPAGTAVPHAAVVKLDGSVVGPSNPAARGSTVAIFLTGLGPTTPLLATGQPGPVPPATTLFRPVILGLNDSGVPAQFSGIAPTFVGLDQVNFTIPADAPVGAGVAFSVSVNGVSSQPSTIAIQ